MTVVGAVELIAVGFAAGLVSVLVSLASLVSYPALLGMGLLPVAANVTNTVALIFTGVGAAAGSRPELAGTRRTVLRLGAVAAVGGAVGAALLLIAPASTFQLVVPFLIGGASAFLLAQPHLARRRQRSGDAGKGWRTGLLGILLFGAAVYAGYFGAAGGILIFAIVSAMYPEWSPQRANAVKSVTSMCANGAAAIGFACYGPVHWVFVAPLALGFLLGGRVGPVLARRLPSNSLRVIAAGCGIALAVKFAV
ncbi:sulfite exporter TauE/SafE family protein [Nocardia yunnanensis]|uniref:Probable membrane transporter protein n=1 Tax=Nocardia yunnanensis TaxID=2382165 RepID=A0A386ZMG6_9NOCA|nr:sulfite exporter TauE/SafE family protein [Nocardia yunnanensis]AYF78646.1 sulfite exporter TauE/SafE family protein [Nocardia yunnanensis]